MKKKTVGRPKAEVQTIKALFKITPEQDRLINVIVAANYGDDNKEKDRSHFVRLAIENYINEFYAEYL